MLAPAPGGMVPFVDHAGVLRWTEERRLCVTAWGLGHAVVGRLAPGAERTVRLPAMGAGLQCPTFPLDYPWETFASTGWFMTGAMLAIRPPRGQA